MATRHGKVVIYHRFIKNNLIIFAKQELTKIVSFVCRYFFFLSLLQFTLSIYFIHFFIYKPFFINLAMIYFRKFLLIKLFPLAWNILLLFGAC